MTSAKKIYKFYTTCWFLMRETLENGLSAHPDWNKILIMMETTEKTVFLNNTKIKIPGGKD